MTNNFVGPLDGKDQTFMLWSGQELKAHDNPIIGWIGSIGS